MALRGPSQVGKTTPALKVAQTTPGIYLDLEPERDLANLAQAKLYLRDHQDKRLSLTKYTAHLACFPC